MRKLIFTMIICVLLGGCIELGFKEGIKVGVEGKRLPVEVAGPNDTPIQVGIEAKDGNALPVEVINRRAVWVALFAAICTAVAAGGAWWSAYNTRLAAEGQLFFELMREYESEKMYDALNDLGNWGREGKRCLTDKELSEKAREWKNELDKVNKQARKLDLARRRVSHYFSNVLLLKRLKYVRKRFLQVLGEHGGKEIIRVVLALEKEKIEDKESYEQLKEGLEELLQLTQRGENGG
jgi:hypothetical protein